MDNGNATKLFQLSLGELERIMAYQCGPLFAGLKVASLFTVKSEQVSLVKAELYGSSYCIFEVFHMKERTSLLLYQERTLNHHLFKEENKQFLQTVGYSIVSLYEILTQFQERYQLAVLQKMEFPHEIGILLGYPIDDVRAFIENNGHHALYSGYWKVYQCVEEKKQLFTKFEQARFQMIQFLIQGITISELAVGKYDLLISVSRSYFS